MTKEQIKILDYLKDEGLKELKKDLITEIKSRIYAYEQHDNRDLWSLQDNISWDETVFQYLDNLVETKLGLNIHDVFEDSAGLDLFLNDYLDLSFDNYMNKHIEKYQELIKNNFVEDLFYELKDKNSNLESLEVKHEKRWNKTYYFIEVELDNEEYILSEKHQVKYSVYFDEREIENELKERIKVYNLELKKFQIQNKIIQTLYNLDQGEEIEDILEYNEEDFEDGKIDYNYRKIMNESNKKIGEIITDNDMYELLHSIPIEQKQNINNELRELYKVNKEIKKLILPPELFKRITEAKQEILNSWDKNNIVNTLQIIRFSNDYDKLHFANTLKDVEEIEQKYQKHSINLPVITTPVTEIWENKNIKTYEYFLQKTNYTESINEIVTQNRNKILNENNIYNDSVTNVEMQDLIPHVDLLYKNNQLCIDINSYGLTINKNPAEIKELIELQNVLTKGMDKEEANTLISLSSHKENEQIIVHFSELQQNVSSYLESKQENLMSKVMVDNVVKKDEKLEIEENKERIEILGELK